MTIFAVVNVKGGVGKTTTAIHLACLLGDKVQNEHPLRALDRPPVLLIDADPQASAAAWSAWRSEREAQIQAVMPTGYPTALGFPSPATACLANKSVFFEGKKLVSGYRHAVIDAGGRDSEGLRGALLLADVAIVPLGASSFDGAALVDLLEIVEIATTYNPDLKVKVLMNRVLPSSRDTREMRKAIIEKGLFLLESQICERVAYRRIIEHGAIVHEMIGRSADMKAVAEMNMFFNEVTA